LYFVEYSLAVKFSSYAARYDVPVDMQLGSDVPHDMQLDADIQLDHIKPGPETQLEIG
jgi:hypothetical protein